jgi:hypothetical protein
MKMRKFVEMKNINCADGTLKASKRISASACVKLHMQKQEN